jgi:acyl-CoA thioesterase I
MPCTPAADPCRIRPPRRPRAAPALLGLLGLLALAACDRGREAASACTLPEGATVLAIGDSLTRGHGADGAGYAEQLQALLDQPGARPGVTVRNLGIDGERSAGLRGRIDDALREHAPSVVLITTGGNDFLRRVGEDETRQHLRAIVERVRDQGAHPVVFAVPRPSLGAAVGLLDEHPLYVELADEGRAEVIADVVTDVLSQESLKADRIHPNRDGYARMAQAAFEVLARCR